MRRRQFMAGVSALGLAWSEAAAGRGADSRQERLTPDAPIEEVSLVELQAAMGRGEWTAEQAVAKYLARIESIDRSGPTLRSVIEVNPDALSIARSLDQERAAGKVRGPLHGIPILLKDNIDTADRMQTTAGSLALAGSIASRDAFLVEQLRKAGAVILGKTNLSEWANFRSSRSSSGWSSRGRQTRNPYALDRNPCGSSSGSGAAVAASLCAAAIGTETDGSIVCPSNANSLVGLKPTLGLVSRSGIIPIAHSQDTAGPMARSVADAAVLLGALAGVDPRDPATSTSRGAQSDYTTFLDPGGLRGARLGVVRNYFGFDPRVDRLMEEALDVLRRQGAILIDPVLDPTKGDYRDSEYEVLLYEFKADLNQYLQGLGEKAPVRSLADVIAFNERHRDRVMPYFGQETMEKAAAKGPLTDPAYRRALAKNHRLTRRLGIDAMMQAHRLDALVAPTGGPAWLTDLVKGDHFGGGFSSAAAVAGYPHLTVPNGYILGLPVGISFYGRRWSEGPLIRLAFAYEQATRHRRPPTYLSTLALP